MRFASLLVGLLLSFGFVILSPLELFACDCIYGGSFVKISKETPLVILIKVKKQLIFKNRNDHEIPMAIEAEVISIFKGNESRKDIRIWGDNGVLCRPYVDTFKAGNYFVIALNNGRRGAAVEDEKESDYYVSACGAFWLNADYVKSTVMGDVDGEGYLTTGKTQTISFVELKAHLSDVKQTRSIE